MWTTLINVLSKYWKPISVLLIVLTVFIGGWKANTYYSGYQQNLERDKQEVVNTALERIEREHAKNLAEYKKMLQDRKVEVVKVDVPKIVEKKVYKNICFEEEGVNKLEAERDYAKKVRGH